MKHLKKKANRLKKDEIRVIKISRKAIEEILWETFMEIGCDKMNLNPSDESFSFHMTTDESLSELVFYAYNNSQKPDFEQINEYIDANVGLTAESLYTVNDGAKCYQTIVLSAGK